MRYATAALVSGGACGHRIKDQWTARIASHLWNLTYVHFPFPKDTWETNGRLPDETKWEPFLGFGDRETLFSQLDLDQLKIVRIDKTEWCGLDLDYVDNIIKSHPEDNVIFFFTESARVLLEQLNRKDRETVITEIRGKYWSKQKTDPIVSYFNRNKLNVALHVRRGADVAPGGRAPWRATPDTYYHGIITNIRTSLPQFEINFHIYSEGPSSIFESYRAIPGIYFHFCPWPPLNYQDLFTSFHHMITADILVTATSEFSYFCAHMNPNITVTLPVARVCELPKENRHLKSKPDGSFDEFALQQNFSDYQIFKREYTMPLYIYTKDEDLTSDIDAAMQWANLYNLEPRPIRSSLEINACKFLQLENPQQRISAIEKIAAFHQSNDFSKIIDQKGKIIAECRGDATYIFLLG